MGGGLARSLWPGVVLLSILVGRSGHEGENEGYLVTSSEVEGLGVVEDEGEV